MQTIFKLTIFVATFAILYNYRNFVLHILASVTRPTSSIWSPDFSADFSESLKMSREVVKILESKEQGEGDGARVRRSIGRAELRNFDPFILMDEARVAQPAGFPDHPHRGFETVTYVLKGCTEHEDFAGNRGTLKEGDLQWMTAGRGIIHAEMPNPEFHGLQLWVNLKSTDKMVEPAYQELKKANIPTKQQNGVKVSIIAGESMGITSPVRTRTPTYYLDFTVSPNSKFEQNVPSDWNCFAYTLTGKIVFGSNAKEIPAHYTVVFGKGNVIQFENKSNEDGRFVLIAGQPIGETVAQHGPFVMNTDDELRQTFDDYRSYKNGFEKAKNWHSVIGNRR